MKDFEKDIIRMTVIIGVVSTLIGFAAGFFCCHIF